MKMYQDILKVFFDYLLALILLPFFVLIFIILVIPLWYSLETFPIFTQNRIGKNNKKFLLYKLKTMTDERNNQGELLPDNLRITKIGKYIRKFSFDELPQLINVLKGNISFVGPRPLLVQYLPLYSEAQIKRHDVKPGISGWAQVNGRNAISWQKKFELDIYYVENQSLLLDTKIIFLTIWAIIKTKNVNKNENITMEYFKGNE